MTVTEILSQLSKLGSLQTKNIFIKHGASEPLYGVQVGDLKVIQKKIKKNHELALELYNTKNADAMYLAGLIADEKKITKSDLNTWVKNASWYMISEYTVACITAETQYAVELGLEWIKSDKQHIASAGWATLSNYLRITPNEKIDIPLFEKLLLHVEKYISTNQGRVKYTMNEFVISIGTSTNQLTEKAKIVAKNIGKISIDMNGTACKVPVALDYIKKVEIANKIGVKKKTVRC